MINFPVKIWIEGCHTPSRSAAALNPTARDPRQECLGLESRASISLFIPKLFEAFVKNSPYFQKLFYAPIYGQIDVISEAAEPGASAPTFP